MAVAVISELQPNNARSASKVFTFGSVVDESFEVGIKSSSNNLSFVIHPKDIRADKYG